MDENLFHPLDQVEAQKKLKLPPNYKYLLFVGTLSQRKGINLLLSAFAELNRPEVKLILIGQSNDRHLIENFRIEHSLQDRILLSGVIPHAQLPLWYAASDVVVLPSLSEGVPNVILEALAIGKPVVASQVGGIPEVLAGNKAAFLCQPGDLNSLFEAIKKALNYSSKIEPFHKFTWEMNTKKYLQIFQEVIRR